MSNACRDGVPSGKVALIAGAIVDCDGGSKPGGASADALHPPGRPA